MKTVIVGGVAGGMSAATRLRRNNETAEIIVFERGEYVSFANCGLPYYVGGIITDRSALLLQTPESLAARFRIDVRVQHDVVSIDRVAKTVTVRGLGGESVESYDHLILAPGASPFVPSIPGVDRALTLRDVRDVDAMAAATVKASTAVVVGAGFIGLEMAENLVHRGLSVALVELADQVLAPLDVEMAALVEQRLRDRGVQVFLQRQVSSVGANEVTLDNGTTLPADLVVMAIGVRPDSALAAEAGLDVGARGGIVVDAQQRTSDPSIFAVGDAVEKRDLVSGEQAMVPLAGPANRHGRLVADVIAGRDVSAAPVLGTAIVGAFGLAAAATGWSEKRCRAAGRECAVIHTHPMNHAGYYPGAAQISLKLVFDPATGEILGAQGVGEDGVDKRIDVIATAMRAGIKADELVDLELSYAPQFGSAKDPVNFLGYIADNIRSGAVETVQWHELPTSTVPLIDVRSAGEFAAGAIPGAVNIPLDDLRGRLDEVPDHSVVHCQVGLRGYLAARILTQAGKHTRNLDGGYKTWASMR